MVRGCWFPGHGSPLAMSFPPPFRTPGGPYTGSVSPSRSSVPLASIRRGLSWVSQSGRAQLRNGEEAHCRSPGLRGILHQVFWSIRQVRETSTGLTDAVAPCPTGAEAGLMLFSSTEAQGAQAECAKLEKGESCQDGILS